MKTVEYMGQKFDVGDDAKYIAVDANGDVYTYKENPMWDGYSYSGSGMRFVGICEVPPPPVVKL